MASYIFLILSLFQLAHLSQQNQYCSITPQHTLCKFQGIGPRCKTPYEIGIPREDRELIMNMHNNYRMIVATGAEKRGKPGPQPTASNMKQMVWDEELAASAQRLADQCKYTHDCLDCRRVSRFLTGQNLYQFSENIIRPKSNWDQAIKAWYEEVADWSPRHIDSFHFIKPLGHYTQMLWADTDRLGCGYAYFNEGKWNRKLYICNYGPAGNIITTPMYERGAPCSNCPSGSFCSQQYPGLCTESRGSSASAIVFPGPTSPVIKYKPQPTTTTTPKPVKTYPTTTTPRYVPTYKTFPTTFRTTTTEKITTTTPRTYPTTQKTTTTFKTVPTTEKTTTTFRTTTSTQPPIQTKAPVILNEIEDNELFQIDSRIGFRRSGPKLTTSKYYYDVRGENSTPSTTTAKPGFFSRFSSINNYFKNNGTVPTTSRYFQKSTTERSFFEPIRTQSSTGRYFEPIRAQSSTARYFEPIKTQSSTARYFEPIRAQSTTERLFFQPIRAQSTTEREVFEPRESSTKAPFTFSPRVYPKKVDKRDEEEQTAMSTVSRITTPLVTAVKDMNSILLYCDFDYAKCPIRFTGDGWNYTQSETDGYGKGFETIIPRRHLTNLYIRSIMYPEEDGNVCLSFRYVMHVFNPSGERLKGSPKAVDVLSGRPMGLRVTAGTLKQRPKIIEITEQSESSSDWLTARIQFQNLRSSFLLIFQLPSNFLQDSIYIALDDVLVTQGLCQT